MLSSAETAAQVLGQLPSGVLIATLNAPTGPVGMMASWVQQVGFKPLSLAIALHPERAFYKALQEQNTFLLHLVAAKRPALMRAFGRPNNASSSAQGEAPFEGLEQEAHAYGPLLKEALGVLACRKVGQLEGVADHVVVVAEIEEGYALEGLGEVEPFVHLRKSATHY